MTGPGNIVSPQYVLRGKAGEGYVRMLLATRGHLGSVKLEIVHTTDLFECIRFCTDKAAKRFAVAVAAHYPYTMHGRYEVIRL